MYDPLIGRFYQEDPIGFDSGDPNLHRYVGNNPTNFTDPSGLDKLTIDFQPGLLRFEAVDMSLYNWEGNDAVELVDATGMMAHDAPSIHAIVEGEIAGQLPVAPAPMPVVPLIPLSPPDTPFPFPTPGASWYLWWPLPQLVPPSTTTTAPLPPVKPDPLWEFYLGATNPFGVPPGKLPLLHIPHEQFTPYPPIEIPLSDAPPKPKPPKLPFGSMGLGDPNKPQNFDGTVNRFGPFEVFSGIQRPGNLMHLLNPDKLGKLPLGTNIQFTDKFGVKWSISFIYYPETGQWIPSIKIVGPTHPWSKR